MSHTNELLLMGQRIESLLADYNSMVVDYASGDGEPRQFETNPKPHMARRRRERERLYAMLKSQQKTIHTLRNRHHKIIVQHAKYRDTL